ncbi:MAG TPA: carboxypeptidase-like regulatory domain-containing protein [Candidatus Acidoferrum sp.]
MSKRLATRFAAVCLSMCPTILFGQSNYATLSGNVLDAQGAAVSGAEVRLTASGTGAERLVNSNEAGLFQVPGLPPGEYQITVKKDGFAEFKQTLRLEVGQQSSLDVKLALASVSNKVEVGANSGPVLRTTDASVGEVVEPAAIQQLPLNGRMLIDLVLTVPGAHEGHGAQTGDMNPLYWRPGQRSSVTIGGARPNANYYLLDGTTNTDPTFNTLNVSPSPDAVQEFKVQTSSYAAEIGGAGGGQINIVTRSGSNQFHGTAYEFLRNGALDAHTFGDMGMSKHLVQNNYGGSLGGPLTRGKTFFFVNYEGLRHSKANTMTDTVPTADEILGDFSMSGKTIYDPTTAHANPNFDPTKPISPGNPQILRDPFPDNQIPQGRINAAAQLFMQQYVPQPSMDVNMGSTMPCGGAMMGQPGVIGAGTDCNNYVDTRNEVHRTDQGTARVDHVFANGDAVYGRYSLSSENGFMPINLPGFGTYHDNFSQQGNVAWNRIVSPRMVNVATLSVSRLAMSHTTESANTNDIVSQLGIQGIGFGGPGAWGAPWFNLQGYSGMGDTYAATPMKAWDTIIEGRDVLSWQKGRHGLKFGGSYRRYVWPMWGFFQNRGYYQFTNGFTTRTATNDGTGSGLASFLLGLPAVKQVQAGIPQMQLRQWAADWFAQDTFQVTRNTTVEFGLRYEFMDPLVDIRYTNSNLTFVDGTPEAFIGGQNGYPQGLLYSQKKNFAPRFGFSQNLPKFAAVIHGAYGIFFTPVDLNTWCNQRHNVPYVFPITQQSDNFIPSLNGFNFAQPVLGVTTVSFTALEPHAPAQYVQQWSFSVEKSLGRETTLEVGYLGAHGVHLQRAHLINNAPPGPGAIGPRRPFPKISFVPDTVFPSSVNVASSTFPVSTINLLENSAQSWYDAGYVNLRRRYSRGLSFLANYTFSKNLSDAPDFRSPMFESSIPQNNSDLAAEKAAACDVKHRFAMSLVYDIPAATAEGLVNMFTRNWHLSTIYQVQSGFPLTISVFGDTANSGVVLGENPIRANVTGQPIFGAGRHTSDAWFNTAAFATPAAFTFGDVGRNTVYGPGMQTLDFAVAREFSLAERTRFQFRAEFFNALNHVNLGTPDRFVNTPQFGTITEAATPGRQIQLSARVSF